MSDQLQVLSKYRWRLAAFLSKYRWRLAAFIVLTVAAAVGLSLTEPKTYEAAARVRVIPSQQLADFLPDPTGLDRFTETFAEVARSTPVLVDAARRTVSQPSPAGLKDSIVVTTERSGVLSIKATTPRARRAAEFANSMAAAFVRHVAEAGAATRRSAVRRINERMRLVTSRLSQARPRSGKAQALLTQLEQLSSRLADSQARPPDQAQIVESASVPAGASSPKPIRSGVLALVVAIFVGSGLAYVHYRLSDRFGSATEASDDLDLPSLGALPKADLAHPSALDAFRVLRTNTWFGLRRRIGERAPERDGTVIVVTSPTKESGKTYVTAGLAHAFAAAGERVVAVDADLRRPSLHKLYNIPLEPGVTDFLDGFCDFLDDTVTEVGLPTRRASVSTDVARRGGAFAFLPAGQPRHDSSEMLSTERMAELIERVRRNFTVAVITSPPSLNVTDAAVLARYADGVILVVDSRRTRRRAAVRAVQELLSLDAPLLGIVFNRASKRDAHYDYRPSRRSERKAKRAAASYEPAGQRATMYEPGSQS